MPPAKRPAADPAADKGARAARFISKLTLTDDYDGQPFALRDWQERRIIAPIFGTLRPDGRRQYRRVFLFLPRKQAKTQICAGIGMYGLKGAGTSGESVICAASSKEQAAHLFDKCVRMIEADTWLASFLQIYRSDKIISDRSSANELRVVSSEGRRQYGWNPSLILFDELQTQKNRELYDALTSASQTRRESLLVLISTAGNDLESLAREEYDYAKRVEENPSIDPSYLPVIFEADESDDIYDERTWFKAMPALGDFCQLEAIRAEFARAKEIPSEEAKCRQYYLNLWTPKAVKWLPIAGWNECAKAPVEIPGDFEGRRCYGGIDLASTRDTAAFVWVSKHEGAFKVACRFWIPERQANYLDRTVGSHFRMWERQGYIKITERNTIDYDVIFEDILTLVDSLDFHEIRMDPYSAAAMAERLKKERVNTLFMRQGTLSMNEPIKFMETLLDRGRLHHGNNPVLNTMAHNVALEKDSHDNVRFKKTKDTAKIDGMVALAMAVGAAMFDAGEFEGGVSIV